MRHFTRLKDDFDACDMRMIKTNRKIEYFNVACGFDIETTSVMVGETKAAFSYIWMLGIGEGKPVYYGRYWSEFLEVCEWLQNELALWEDRRLVVYVHNLGYEFQFMRHYFEWLQIFAVDERKPIRALCSYGIEFRDSYILSGYSLANTAKNLAKRKIRKLEGDLDYTLIRHNETPLSDSEMDYCNNDIEIITAYIGEQIELYQDVSKIPMTNTGRVRSYVRNECYYSSKSHKKTSKKKFIDYRKIMGDLTLTPEVYDQLRRAFMGGFTHANATYSGKTLEGVSSIDFTSSYPAVMVSEKFPMSRFKSCDVTTLSELKELCDRYCAVFELKLTGVKPKLSQESYISESKCYLLKNPTINNGRVDAADELAITVTDVDFDIIEVCYSWETIQIADVKYAHKNYLPKAIIKSILDLYQGKTELKDVEGYETEYLLSKGMLNSIYGMCVTDIVKDNSVYEGGEWGISPVDKLEEIDSYNKSMNRFLYYPWGIWVTAFARRNLWTGIVSVGEDYVYSDTDSLKMLNYESHGEYIQWFNQNIVGKMSAMCEYYGFDKSLLEPKTKQGKSKMLGVWDFEGTYSRFKTLGAKRYMVQDGEKLAITVAGLSKQNGINYMREKCDNDLEQVFAMFDDTLYIPAERTGKMTHTYIDEELKFKVTDYLGSESVVNPLSGIHLEPCDFTLSISTQYAEFIRNFRNGYIYKGVNHQ